VSEKTLDLPYIERQIGEHVYRCPRLLLGRWLDLEALLMKVLGVQVLDLDENNLGAYAPKAIASSTAQDHEKIFELLGECPLAVKNAEGGWSMLSRETQEKWWPVYISEMPAVVALFFEVQFKDFFIGLEKLLPEETS
jgi:hypothetical protein